MHIDGSISEPHASVSPAPIAKLYHLYRGTDRYVFIGKKGRRRNGIGRVRGKEEGKKGKSGGERVGVGKEGG